MVTEERKKQIAETCRAWVAEQTCTKAHQFTVGSCIACERDELMKALQGMVDLYTTLINSGDAGNWDPESDKPVIAARAALANAS
jgi:hypothetical protein